MRPFPTIRREQTSVLAPEEKQMDASDITRRLKYSTGGRRYPKTREEDVDEGQLGKNGSPSHQEFQAAEGQRGRKRVPQLPDPISQG